MIETLRKKEGGKLSCKANMRDGIIPILTSNANANMFIYEHTTSKT
jgi:hypothetical protein